MPAETNARRVRDARIDSLRVVAILSVVAGHAISAPYASHPENAPTVWAVAFGFMATYNVQLFVFLSGWVARKGVGLRWVSDRALRLLVPYVAWTVVQQFLRHPGEGWRSFVEIVTHPALTNAGWFLPALFLCSAAYAALRRSDALLVGVAVAFVFWTPAVTFLGLDRAAAMFPFFVGGHLTARLKPDLRWLAVTSPLFVAACWTHPGIGLQWTIPSWYVAWAGTASGLPAVLVQAPLGVARFGASMSLIALWYVALAPRRRRATAPEAREDARRTWWRGAAGRARQWLALNTLGLYLCHVYFLLMFVGTGTLAIVTSFASAMAGGVALTMLLGLTRPTAGVFLGDWRRARRIEAAPST